MNRYLIILLGANYVNPMIVFGDIDNIIKNLSNESAVLVVSLKLRTPQA